MRVLDSYHAWCGESRARRSAPALVVIVCGVVAVAGFTGQGGALFMVIALTAVTVIVEELMRAVLRNWMRKN